MSLRGQSVAADRERAYWSEAGEALLARMGSSERGLTTGEAADRLRRSGPNALRARRRITPLDAFLGQFRSPITWILLVATGISAATGDWLDALIITLIVLGSALLSASQEYRAGSAVEELRARTRIIAQVWRDGHVQSVPAEQIVPGDVVELSAGRLVPADGFLLQAQDLFLSEAVLTGETFPASKEVGRVAPDAPLAKRTNCVLMGTNVSSGFGRALIIHTGASTALGHVATRLTSRAPETEFEHGIRHLGYLLSEVMFVLVLVIFSFNILFNRSLLDSLLFSVALAVGLTPQLLPAIITVNLSRGAQTMASAGVIVKRLAAIENFGSMDFLCTDKTGTITQGIVRLDAALDWRGSPSEQVFRLAYLNAYFEAGLANPLDKAILAARSLPVDGVSKVGEIPYDFVRKRLSVLVAEGGRHVLVTKGAMDRVLDVCSTVREGDRLLPLGDSEQGQIQQQFEGWSAQGFRVLGVAVRVISAPVEAYSRADERDMELAGFLLFFDPPKEGVREVVAGLRDLGVRLKIITGDNRLVARHAAEMIGLAVERILTGAEIADLSDEALWRVAEDTQIFAEVDPNEKERIILALKRTEHVVGYMGDGINDAPALHAADVSLSIDNAVDVAKEAADLILLQRDLGVLQRGIVAGRQTFANTLKYVYMATSANFGNMFSMAGASLFLPFLPMLPKQLLAINFLTDLPELAIATDNVDPQFLTLPHRWDIHAIRRFMATFGTLSSVFDYLTFGLLFLLGVDETLFRTAWFVESVASAALVVLSLRTRLPIHRSKAGGALMAATASVVLLAALLPYTPLAGPLGFGPLTPMLLVAIVGLVIGYVSSAELAKRLFYRRVAP